VIDVAGC